MKVVFGLVALVGLAVAGNAARIEAGGIHNAINPKYWIDRAVGRDLYDAQFAILKNGDRAEKAVALTFDDGPHPDSADMILDTLDKYGVKATFFVVGERVVEHPEVVQRMIAEGHEVGNHTFTHPALDRLSIPEVRHEIEECGQAVENATGHEMTLFRPPHMRATPAVAEMIKSLGYTTIDYGVAAGDFVFTAADKQLTAGSEEKPECTPDVIASRVLKQVKNGSIILLHDSPSTAEALPSILRGLARDGYKVETITQMLAALPKPISLVSNPVAKDAAFAAMYDRAAHKSSQLIHRK